MQWNKKSLVSNCSCKAAFLTRCELGQTEMEGGRSGFPELLGSPVLIFRAEIKTPPTKQCFSAATKLSAPTPSCLI